MKTDLMTVLDDPWSLIFGGEDEYHFTCIGRSQRPCRDGVYVMCRQSDVMTSLRRICLALDVAFKQRNANQLVIKQPKDLLRRLNAMAASERQALFGSVVVS